IGQGGPVSVGAAVACPHRRVVSLLGDGAFMYTLQALWTQARERLNITTIIYKNEKYRILEIEYWRLGVNSIGEKASGLFNLVDPSIDYCSIARGMGVQSVSVDTVESFKKALGVALTRTGPYLIEACIEVKEKSREG
ncbi:thiamine pyrophosphate-dependent enzyme, partial [Gammaproteobacteria bacterium]|nr:thiamine pyrophosphate-dependent enzyme [Gammaproteobacteria bacterium]